MNKRIKELALQANPASKEIYESDNWEYNCAAWCAQDLEKFAELIVKECLEQIDKMRDGFEADNEDQQALGADWAGLAVARHFGVE